MTQKPGRLLLVAILTIAAVTGCFGLIQATVRAQGDPAAAAGAGRYVMFDSKSLDTSFKLDTVTGKVQELTFLNDKSGGRTYFFRDISSTDMLKNPPR